MGLPRRLVEIWAAAGPGAGGKCGSGWVVGASGVLTARHVVSPFMEAATDGSGPGTCQIRLAGSTSVEDWMDCEVSWSHPSVDTVLLKVSDVRWRPPADPPVRLAGMGERPFAAEAVGFPDADTRPDGIRKPEQPVGDLLPAGGGRDEQGRVPFDVSIAVPDDAKLWRGISGAAVRDKEYGRLVGVVSGARPDRQSRRLLVIAVEDAASDPAFAPKAKEVGLDPTVEDVSAPLWRASVRNETLEPTGVPLTAVQIKDLKAFGVHVPAFPSYLPRSKDRELDRALEEAAGGGRRLVLVLGDSAAGKSRSAAEALLRHDRLKVQPLVAPSLERGLTHLLDSRLPIDKAVVWLDDLDKHLARGLDPARIDQVLQENPRAVVLATMRTEQLLNRQSGLSDPAWDLLTDDQKVICVDLAAQLDETELSGARTMYSDPALLRALDDGIGLGEWLVAGPELMKRLGMGTGLEKAFVHTVVAWDRTGLEQPLAEGDARRLWIEMAPKQLHRQLIDRPEQQRQAFDNAADWACQPVLSRELYEQALTYRQSAGFIANDYVVDRIARQADRPPIPKAFWDRAHELALTAPGAVSNERVWNVGISAYHEGQTDHAETAMRALAKSGNTAAMFNLGVILQERGTPAALAEAEKCYRDAAWKGFTYAMVNLGLLLLDKDTPEALAEAEDWLRIATNTMDTDAMNNLGLLLRNKGTPEALAEAEDWWRAAATEGNPDAMINLGGLLQELGTRQALTEAEHWYRAAAGKGRTGAMVDLVHLLRDERTPDSVAEAEHWRRIAISKGNTHALSLGPLVLNPGTPEVLANAEDQLRVAAGVGYPAAMFDLGLFLRGMGTHEALAEAEGWWRAAADKGHAKAACDLGVLQYRKGTPEALAEAEGWWRAAAEKGHAAAMNNLGVLLNTRAAPENLAEAERFYRAAAAKGHSGAMVNLGMLLQGRGTPEALAEAEGSYTALAKGREPLGSVFLTALRVIRGEEESARTIWQSIIQDQLPLATIDAALILAVEGKLEWGRMMLTAARDSGISEAEDFVAVLSGAAAGQGRRYRLIGAANAGDTTAANVLGAVAYIGNDKQKARNLWNQSAASGDLTARLLLQITDRPVGKPRRPTDPLPPRKRLPELPSD